MHGLKRISAEFSGSEAPPTSEQIASMAREQLFEELNFSPFKTSERPASNQPQASRPQPRNLFAEPSAKGSHQTSLTEAVSKLAEAQQRAVDLLELVETQRSSKDTNEASKAESTLARAKMQQRVAETLSKKVSLLEQFIPPTNQSFSERSHPAMPSVGHNNGTPNAFAQPSTQQTQSAAEAPCSDSVHARPSLERSLPQGAHCSTSEKNGVSDAHPSEHASARRDPIARNKAGLTESETYLLPSRVDISGKCSTEAFRPASFILKSKQAAPSSQASQMNSDRSSTWHALKRKYFGLKKVSS